MKRKDDNQGEQTPPPRAGVTRRAFGVFWALFRPNYKRRFQETIADDGARQIIGRSYQNLWTYVLSRIKNNSPFPESFEEVQSAWGVDDSELAQTIRGLALQSIIFSIFTILMVIASFKAMYDQYLFSAGIYLILSFSMIFIVLVLRWRVHVLKNRHAVSFKQWLMK